MYAGRRIAAALATVGLIVASLSPAAAQTPPSPAADALKVTFCGTSGPLPVRDRAKPCLAVQAGGDLYLVDVGPESVENLQLWRTPMAAAKAVFITHLHSDHIGDLGEFNMQSWVAGRPSPLPVVGPKGVDQLVRGFNEAYTQDHIFRHAHHEHDGITLPIAAGLMTPKVVVLPAKPDAEGVERKQVWSKDGLTVTAIAVEHSPASPAFAYRFDYKGRSVVVSGDTRKHPPLATASKGADVLIHEAQNNDMTRMMSAGLKAQGNPRLASIMGDTVTYHTTPVEAEEIAKAAGVKALVLTHLTQAGLPFFTPQTFTKGIDAVGGPGWRLADDGMTITLPAGGDQVVFGHQ